MATRSFIGMLENGVLRGIYCHWDGYPSNNGNILVNHYTNVQKIKELIDLGSLSSLGENVNPTDENHSWNNPQKGVCVAYHRDRDEDLAIDEFKNLDEIHDYFDDNWIDYIYIYVNEKWYCCYYKNDELFGCEITKDNVEALKKDDFLKLDIFNMENK